ncbi:methyltransferase domain-containing protein [bacterium]|nr:methyltransferase domain-containing protein [bacterium]
MTIDHLIKELMEDYGIYNREILNAVRKIDRKHFVPEKYSQRAYKNKPIPLVNGQTSTRPSTICRFISKIGPSKEKTVLELGTGSGYQAALLSELFGSVVSYEIDETLYLWSHERLKIRENITQFHKNPMSDFQGGSFDAIVFSFSTPIIPEYLKKSLKENGILLAPYVKGKHQYLLNIINKNGIIKNDFTNYETFVKVRGLING